ncbi:MAG: helix-turn-helix transcriptional regulator [Planctomycetes bacterium]|nr:helix-turn-helix transcriptional regulator [Planctomycetota bacterium]
MTQRQLALRTGINPATMNRIERSQRRPTLGQLLSLAKVLQVSLQWFLRATNWPGVDLPDIAIELHNLGIVDLVPSQVQVPGAFRPREEVIALALTGNEPEPRVIEALPAALAWHPWNVPLLRAFGQTAGRQTVYRIAWLADITLAIDKHFGFPLGCPGRKSLARFLTRVQPPGEDRSTTPRSLDGLGRPTEQGRLHPIWRRWHISYAADLTVFRDRAEHLKALLAGKPMGEGPHQDGRTDPPITG